MEQQTRLRLLTRTSPPRPGWAGLVLVLAVAGCGDSSGPEFDLGTDAEPMVVDGSLAGMGTSAVLVGGSRDSEPASPPQSLSVERGGELVADSLPPSPADGRLGVQSIFMHSGSVVISEGRAPSATPGAERLFELQPGAPDWEEIAAVDQPVFGMAEVVGRLIAWTANGIITFDDDGSVRSSVAGPGEQFTEFTSMTVLDGFAYFVMSSEIARFSPMTATWESFLDYESLPATLSNKSIYVSDGRLRIVGLANSDKATVIERDPTGGLSIVAKTGADTLDFVLPAVPFGSSDGIATNFSLSSGKLLRDCGDSVQIIDLPTTAVGVSWLGSPDATEFFGVAQSTVLIPSVGESEPNRLRLEIDSC